MSGFRYISFASIFALFYTGIVLLVELPGYIDQNYATAVVTPAYFDLNIFQGASLTFFAYTCQIQLLPIYSELVAPNQRRINKVITRSIAVDVIFYLAIALSGFFSTYNNTDRIVLERTPLGDTKIDYAIIISQIAIILVIIASVPINYNPFRNQVFYMFLKKEDITVKE
jgi:amino acid permease